MISVPLLPNGLDIEPDWVKRCRQRTRIDREGMSDAECQLPRGHAGDWHYAPRTRDWEDEIWWRPGGEP